MSWLRKEPIGPAVTTTLNQMLRADRTAPAHRAMPTKDDGVAMAPDMVSDGALAGAGLSYLDVVKGTLIVTFCDGDYVEATDFSKRDYLRLRNNWTLARSVPCFIPFEKNFAINAAEISAVRFEVADDEAAQIFTAIRRGSATINDLRSFAADCREISHAGL